MSENAKEKRRFEAEEAAKKKKKYTWIKIAVILALILCVVLTVMESNFINRMIPAVTVDDTTYSVAEYNWLYNKCYTNVYNSLYSTYGDYASYIIDASKPLDEQQYSEDMTWADYIAEQTDDTAKTMTALTKEAKLAGYELPEEYKTVLDSNWESLVTAAKQYGTDTVSLVTANFGKGVNEKVFRDMDERYYYAFTYAETVNEDIAVSDADIDAKYKENPKAYDMADYSVFFISGMGDDGEKTDEAMKAAKESADAVVASENPEAYVKENLDGDFSVTKNGRYYEGAYSDWVFDSARKAGDITAIEAESGYYVVKFLEKGDIHYNTVSVRHLLVKPEDESDEGWNAALEKVKEYEKTWKDLGGDENSFANVALGYSEDEGSKNNGGLYENIAKGDMVDEFNDWCFDSTRKPGDSGIVKTSYGYHLIYFVGEGEDYYKSSIGGDIRNERYNEYLEGLAESVTLENKSGKKLVGRAF